MAKTPDPNMKHAKTEPCSELVRFRIPRKMYKKVALRDATVLVAIQTHADLRKPDYSCFPAKKRIQDIVGCCKQSVDKSVNILVDKALMNKSTDKRHNYYKFKRRNKNYEVCSSTFVYDNTLTYEEKGYILFSLEFMKKDVKGEGRLEDSIEDLSIKYHITLKHAKKIEASLVEKGVIKDVQEVFDSEHRVFDLARFNMNMKGVSVKDPVKTSKESYVSTIKDLKGEKEESDSVFRDTMKVVETVRVKEFVRREEEVEPELVGPKSTIKVALPHNMHKGLNIQDMLVYVTLKIFRGKTTKRCHPSVGTIGRRLGITKEAVKESIENLLSKGYMTTEREDNRTYYCFEDLEKDYEVITSDFLNNKELTLKEKGYILVMSQYMFRDIEGFGKVSFDKDKRVEKTGIPYPVMSVIERDLVRKRYITPLALKKYLYYHDEKKNKDIKLETAVEWTEELVFDLSKLHLVTPVEEVHIDCNSPMWLLSRELRKANKALKDSRKSVGIAKRHLKLLLRSGGAPISGCFVHKIFAA